VHTTWAHTHASRVTQPRKNPRQDTHTPHTRHNPERIQGKIMSNTAVGGGYDGACFPGLVLDPMAQMRTQQNISLTLFNKALHFPHQQCRHLHCESRRGQVPWLIRADPQPFAPDVFQTLEMQHREPMVHVVMRHMQPVHEDYAITSLPANPMQLVAVYEVVQDFLEEHMNVRVRDIHPTHLGQALVCFVNVHGRDLLINNSPHPYAGAEFHLARHNQGWNWIAMYLGFPLDYWNNHNIQNVIASFRRMLVQENDRHHLARLLVRVIVIDLQHLPHFIVLIEAVGCIRFLVQCLLMRTRCLR
jgi:hypothetical protein